MITTICKTCGTEFQWERIGTRPRKKCDACKRDVAIQCSKRKRQDYKMDFGDELYAGSTAAMSWAEIGERIGVSRGRAAQIYAVAMRKIRKHPIFRDGIR